MVSTKYLVIIILVISVIGGLIVYETGTSLPNSSPPPPPQGLEKWENKFIAGQGILRNYNDPVLVIEPDKPYPYKLIVFEGLGVWGLYRAKNIEGPWERYYQISVNGHETPQWCRKSKDGKYYVYTSVRDSYTCLYIGDSLETLKPWGKVLDYSDSGGFYDPDTDTWHLFAEVDPAEGDPCGWAIGHWTSKDGKTGWVYHGKAIDLRAEGKDWHTGDPDIIKINDVYYMFIDHTDPNMDHHPYYYIHVYYSKDLFNWKEIGQVTTRYGGDACVRLDPETGIFYMFNEYWYAPSQGVGWQKSIGPKTGLTYTWDPKYNRMDIYTAKPFSDFSTDESWGGGAVRIKIYVISCFTLLSQAFPLLVFCYKTIRTRISI